MGCLFNSTLVLTCEVWTEDEYQDELSGQVIREWVAPSKPINCDVMLVSSSGKRSSTEEIFMKEYKYEEYFYIVTSQILNHHDRITNIKSKDGIQIYIEPNGNPTIFEIRGVIPIVDELFGSIQGAKSFINRASVQDLSYVD